MSLAMSVLKDIGSNLVSSLAGGVDLFIAHC